MGYINPQAWGCCFLTDISVTFITERGNNFGDVCSARMVRAKQPTWVRLTQDVRSHTICFAPWRAREAGGGADLTKESVCAGGLEGLQVMEELAWCGAAMPTAWHSRRDAQMLGDAAAHP